MRLLRRRGLISFCVFGFWPDYYFTHPLLLVDPFAIIHRPHLALCAQLSATYL